MSPYIRTVKTSSGARAVQIVHSSRRGSREIEHIGSAHDEVELELLKTVARQRLVAGQEELDLGLDRAPEAGEPLPITASRMGHLWDALGCAYDALGFEVAAGGDQVFRQLALARIIEPTSKLDPDHRDAVEPRGVLDEHAASLSQDGGVRGVPGHRECLSDPGHRQVRHHQGTQRPAQCPARQLRWAAALVSWRHT